MTSSQKFSLKLIWLPALILCITYISFYPSFQCGFVNWDDPVMVTGNHLVVSNTLKLKEIFTTPVAFLYHPLTTLSLACNYQACKLNPLGYHSWNIYLHLFNTLFVFIFIYLLTEEKLPVAAIVALLFGIHPMHVESVTWVTERKDVLYMFFFLSGLITYLYYRKTNKAVWFIITLLLFLLSLLSKAHAIVFPFILLLIDYFLNEKWRARLITEKIPFFIISAALSLFTYSIMQSGGNMSAISNAFSAWQRVCFITYGLLWYPAKLLFPFNLSAHYPYRLMTSGGLHFYFYLCPFILAGIITAVYFFMRKKRVVMFGLFFYLISIAPVLQIVTNNNALTADRYSYLSGIGLFFIPAYWISSLWENKQSKLLFLKIPAIAICTLFLAMCSYLTFQQSKVWFDSLTLWNHALSCNPQNFFAYVNRGGAYRLKGETDLAIADFTTAINLNPRYEEEYCDRGLAYWEQGKPELAKADYYRAIKLNPKYPHAYILLGNAFREQAQPQIAIAKYDTAISINPKDEMAYYNRGVAYANLDKPEAAISDFSTAIRLQPQLDLAYSDRGIAYAKQGKIDLALNDFNTAIDLNPNDAFLYFSRGLAYLSIGKPEPALVDLDSAIALNPKLDMAYFKRGVVYANRGQIELAMADFNMAIKLNPQNSKAYINRGSAFAAEGKAEQAIADFTSGIKLNPAYAQAYFNRAVIERQKGDSSEAKKDFQKAKELGWGLAK